MLSEAARKFITESNSATWDSVDLSPEGVKQLRYDNSEVGNEAWKLVGPTLTTSVKTSEEDIGGVMVLWVFPADIKEPNDSQTVGLFFFGGAFVVGSPEDDMSMVARLASQLQKPICVPRYRRAPEHNTPAAVNDAMVVFDILSEKHHLFVVGESAGGNLALHVVLQSVQRSVQKIRAVVLFSPWIDLSHSGDSHQTLQGHDPTLSVEHFLKLAADAYRGTLDANDPAVSPLFAEFPPSTGYPPTLISSGTRDLLLSDCTRLAKKLRTVNCSCELRVAEGLFHVFEWYPQFPETTESMEEVTDFLKKHL